jgi:nicotinate-nucleotide adenylyltransferase
LSNRVTASSVKRLVLPEPPTPARRRRVGILGGTFDPIHIGHLILAEEARLTLSLDRVIFMPAGRPWRKPQSDVSPAQHRLAMLTLAIMGNPAFEVSRIEVDREGATYTADTLQELHAHFDSETDAWFILGSDALLDLQHWRDPARILAQVRLAVATRGALTEEELAPLVGLLPNLKQRTDAVPMPPVGISSSELRRRLRDGVSTRYWLPNDVRRYAAEHGLYGGSQQCR